MKSTRIPILLSLVACLLATVTFTAEAAAQAKKPNILLIWGDDIGHDNISAYHRGMLGGRTPNIDRLAKEGMLFTDCYA
ncbi:MAG: sulfatase-like hydrolase/transferase, partial [Bythopirellula sp.]